MVKILGEIATFIYLIPFILGLSKFPNLSKREKLFFYFCTAAAGCSLLSYFTHHLGNNLYVAYIFNTAEILILPLFLLNYSDQKKHKIPWFFLVFIGLGLVSYEAFFREGGVTMYNSISLTYAALALSILSIRHLLLLRFDPHLFDLSKSSLFWFTLGVGIYYLGSILFFAFMRLFQQQDLQVLTNIYSFRLVINIVSVLVLSWGFFIIKTNSSNGTLVGKSK